tara:strand:+ start:54 stop:1022 length:969 start_codon:yes stop_codon:yes gene_type:complete
MRRILTILLFAMLLMPMPVQAVPPADIYNQGVLGGFSLDLTNSSNNSTTIIAGGAMDEIQVVEVYTATWCDNCVDSEHALMEMLENESATVLVHHRFIAESEDPFGTQEGDDRWISLYGEACKESVGLERAPPTVIMDGDRLKVGSSPNERDNLHDEYADMFADKNQFRTAGKYSSLNTWTGNNSSGLLDWSAILPGDSEFTWNHRAMVVEDSAYFPDGSNGLDYYEDVVRMVIELEDMEMDNEQRIDGNTHASGVVHIDLPSAWDGDDLSIVVVHEWNHPEVLECLIPEGCDGDEDSGLLSGFLAPIGIIALGAAAFTRRD